MQSELPKPQNDSYNSSELAEFFQENWIYLAIIVVIIYVVIMYARILKDRRKNH